MMHRLAFVFTLAALGACSSGREVARPVVKVFEEDERAPEKSAGWCNQCNMGVYSGHRCGLTAPCQLCQREAGARHLHEVAWRCDYCDIVIAKQHQCVDAKSCGICRQDKHEKRTLLGTTGCDR